MSVKQALLKLTWIRTDASSLTRKCLRPNVKLVGSHVDVIDKVYVNIMIVLHIHCETLSSSSSPSPSLSLSLSLSLADYEFCG